MKKTRENDQLSLDSNDETEVLSRLGERVDRAVQMIQTLRQERDTLRRRLEKAESEIATHEQNQDRMTSVESEVEKFRSERSEIRNRIEDILGSLESIEEETADEQPAES